MPSGEPRLPIKVVIAQEQDHTSPPAGGGPRKVFGTANRDMRALLLSQVGAIRAHFGANLAPGGLPVVARVVLKQAALAKSHRPRHVFTRDTCPIIGGEAFGNLLVSVRSDGLARLEQAINSQTMEADAELSAIARVEPFTADDALGALGLEGLAKLLGQGRTRRLKIRLFHHADQRLNDRVLGAFKELLLSLGLGAPEQLDYAEGLRLFRIPEVPIDKLPGLARFVGTQSVRPFPQFHLVAQYVPQGAVTATVFPAPEKSRQYPVVGLIDSGTDSSNPLLQAWVIHRDADDVPPGDQDNNHGSFVAGLIANARGLNHGDARFPGVQAKLLDVVAMPKDGTPIFEDELLRTISRVVAKYRDVKVWNLSISRVSDVCQDDAFSDFAVALDDLQERHDVTFVVCAGNCTPPRSWPAPDLGQADRVHPPADSIHAVTVGSLAHNDHASTRVRRGEPSPFSRRGPGAAYLPKPEVCHYGGNCDAMGDCRQVGVLSLDGDGHVAEAIGTSFSTPLVATILANIRAGVAEPISRNLAKALLVQSAALASQPVVAKELPYRGFGVPGDVADILTCAPWQATLIFEPELLPQRKLFAKADFPIPACFRRPDGTIEGEFLMTLVYDPPRDPAAGAEYCRTNVDVSLGTYDLDSGGHLVHEKQIPLQPKDYSALFEEHLVTQGFKWSPVKVFRRSLRRTEGSRWRLQMQLLHRSGEAAVEPQGVALVVTMFDPLRQRAVYDDVVRAMAVSGWITQDLRVDDRIRAHIRG